MDSGIKLTVLTVDVYFCVIFTFDKPRLLVDLQRLSPYLRVVCAAACAERQMPTYRLLRRGSVSESSDELIRALDDVWTNPIWGDAPELRRQLEACMQLVPREEWVTPWTEQASYAQEAGISMAYALRTGISGEAEDAAWAAQTAYELLDHFVMNRADIDTSLRGSEEAVLAHPLIQAELSRQYRDLDELLATDEPDLQQVVTRFRERAKAKIDLMARTDRHYFPCWSRLTLRESTRF